MHRLISATIVAALLALPVVPLAAWTPAVAAEPLQTAVEPDDIDAAATAECVGGRVRELPGTASDAWLGIPGRTNAPAGLFFGVEATPGPRYFRIGFTREIALGTVVTRGLGRLSVLRPNAAYPGDPAREADWLPAERLRETQISVWILPPGTKTRALRWSVEGAPAAQACPDLWRLDPLPEGQCAWFGGLYAFSQRLMNVAPYAEIIPLTPGPDAHRLADGEYRVWRNFGGPNRSWNVWETRGAKDIRDPLSLIYAWPKPLTLAGAGLCFPGVSQTRLETYAGPAERNPREAPESAWTAALEQPVRSRYPAGFDVEWLGLGKPAATTALRLTGLTTLAAKDVAPDVASMIQDRRAWLGDTLVLADLGDRAPADVAKDLTVAKAHPPIPIRFNLKEPGYVTLVIEDAQGNRVRNLVSETRFPAGENTVWWDGLDDHRIKNNPPEVDGRLVDPGDYRVRGLVRGPIDLRYEFTVYNPVNPPWRTADRKGQWLSDHKPPSDVCFVPGEKPFMLIGSPLAEGTHGLVWTDLDGNKLTGFTGLGGWAGAPYLAYDRGPNRNADTDAYAAGAYGDVLFLRAIRGQSPQPVLRPDLTFPQLDGGKRDAAVGDIAGLAAFDRMLVVSSPAPAACWSWTRRRGASPARSRWRIRAEWPLPPTARLICATAKGVFRFPPFTSAALPAVAAAAALVTEGLDDPHGIAMNKAGDIYVSDRGRSHQVKVYSPPGKFLRTIGKAGVPGTGKYDELRMNNPGGVAVTDDGRIWVAEEDCRPKRVSVWSPEGKLLFAKYGPPRYGGGGHIDPLDKTRFYYEGMEFKLDWDKGTDRLVSVYHRPGSETDLNLWGSDHGASMSPETPIHHGGRQYMVNVYNANPVGGPRVAGVWLMRDGRAHLVAAAGLANALEPLQAPEILAVVPKTDKKDHWGNNVMDITRAPTYGRDNAVLFTWSDVNLNGKVDPDEVTFARDKEVWISSQPPQRFAARGLGALNITRDMAFVGGTRS